MRIFLKIFILILSTHTHAKCEFKKEIQRLISLSGSSTVLLKDFGLLKSPVVKGVSVFNPITNSDFTGKIYPGGIFISHQELKGLEKSIVLYDENRELRRIFDSHPSITSREIKTRSLAPAETVEATLSTLSEFIVGCDEEIIRLNKKVKDLQQEILKKIPTRRTMIFYLGAFIGDRAPQMVMANDGIVKWLVDEKKIFTYPTELAYVNWSTKIIQALPREAIHIALKDSGRNGERNVMKSSDRITLIYPGLLVPGLSQLEAFLFLITAI